MIRRGGLMPALALSAGLAVAACGFQPLYGDLGGASTLSRIAVETPDTRAGFELRQQLEDALAFDRSAPALWRLETTIEQSRTPIGRRIDDTVARYELRMVVDYRLTPIAGGEAVADRVTATTTYASADQAYAGVAAQRDGEDRVVAEAARRLRLDLARLMGPPARP